MLFAIISNDIFKVSEGTLRRAGRMVALRSAQSYTPMRESRATYGSSLPQPMDSFMFELYPKMPSMIYATNWMEYLNRDSGE